MTCAQIEGLLTRYLLGDLEPADQAQVETHLASCPACRAATEQLRPTVVLLRQALSAHSEDSPRLDPTRRARILASYRPHKPEVTSMWTVVLRVAAIAAILFVFAGLLLPAVSLRGRVQHANIAATRVREQALSTAADMYEVDHGRKPQAAADLVGYIRDGSQVTDAEVKRVTEGPQSSAPMAAPAEASARANADSVSMAELSRPTIFGGPMMDVPSPRSSLARHLGEFVAGIAGKAEPEVRVPHGSGTPPSTPVEGRVHGVAGVSSFAFSGKTPDALGLGAATPAPGGQNHYYSDPAMHKDVEEANKPTDGQAGGREVTALSAESAGENGISVPAPSPLLVKGLYASRSTSGRAKAEAQSHAENETRLRVPEYDGDSRSDVSGSASVDGREVKVQILGYTPTTVAGVPAAVPQRDEALKENTPASPVVMDFLEAGDQGARGGNDAGLVVTAKPQGGERNLETMTLADTEAVTDQPTTLERGKEQLRKSQLIEATEVREELQPKRPVDASQPVVQKVTKKTEDKADETLRTLDKIIIPEIEFRQANIHDIVDFLNKATVEAGAPTSGEAKKDTTFVLNLGDADKKAGESDTLSQTATKTEETAPDVTFTARSISMLSALKIITQVSGLKYKVVDGTVMIEPQGYSAEEIKTAAPPPAPIESSESAVEPVYPPQVFNPIVETKQSEFSTFGIDVDTASFTLARRSLLQGRRPPEGAIRVEEFVNAFEYAYRAPERDTFAVYADRARSPFRPSVDVLRIGVRGKVIGRDRMRTSVLTFVIDTSGSMNTPDRLDLIRKALVMLVDHLAPQDTVTVVAFASEARLVLDQTPASQKDAIRAAITGLQTYGSTHLEGGLRLGYEVAARNFRSGAINRVLLLSDGVANLGAATAQGILAQVERYKNQGIYCSVFGVGQGTYNDTMLETLADKGDGVYRYVDSLAEARRVFVDDLAATLCVIAKDVKIQVQFDPARVTRYRQLGYEKRHLEKEQFRDDTVDAGEVGAGQSATALYEITVAGNPAEPLGTVRLRWKDVETGKVEERAVPLKADDRYGSFETAPVRFRLAAGVAEFADLLRRNPNTAGTTVRDVAAVLRPVGLELNLDQQVQDLVRMVNGVRE